MENFEIKHQVDVQWGDLDAANHVNNIIYLRWIESARVKYFLHLNNGKLKNEDNVGPVVAWQDCKYIRPVNYPDTVTIGIRKIENLDDRIVLEAKIYSDAQKRVVAVSQQHMVSFDFKTKTKAPLPMNWLYNE